MEVGGGGSVGGDRHDGRLAIVIFLVAGANGVAREPSARLVVPAGAERNGGASSSSSSPLLTLLWP